jgi:TetR/AcrR family transcriptional regulator, transcriptional repressor for nem operon
MEILSGAALFRVRDVTRNAAEAELASRQIMFKNIIKRSWPHGKSMPYSAEHKARTRAKIVETARIMFNRHGFEQVSIDDIMKHAGLTRGGFYNHFASKNELYAAAVHSFTSCNPFERKRESARGGAPPPRKVARMLVEMYLADETLANVDQQCPLIALPSDVARAGLKPRAAYTQVIESMLCVFRSAFGENDAAAEEKAQLMVNLCVGGMVLARTTDEPALRRSLRASARREALALLDR